VGDFRPQDTFPFASIHPPKLPSRWRHCATRATKWRCTVATLYACRWPPQRWWLKAGRTEQMALRRFRWAFVSQTHACCSHSFTAAAAAAAASVICGPPDYDVIGTTLALAGAPQPASRRLMVHDDPKSRKPLLEPPPATELSVCI